MKYLNVETSILHAPEYIGSNPTQRGTWWNVSLYSALRENSGCVSRSKDWGDRQWQQTCGVTKDEVDGASPLLTWRDADLLVWGYPIEQERAMQAKREIARRNGEKGGRPPQADHAFHDEGKPTSVPASVPASEPRSETVMECKVMEGKENLAPAGAVAVGSSRAARQPDHVFEALAEVSSIDHRNPTATERGKLNAALKEIRQVCPALTPELVRHAAKRWAQQHPGTPCTPHTVAGNWSTLTRGMVPGSANVDPDRQARLHGQLNAVERDLADIRSLSPADGDPDCLAARQACIADLETKANALRAELGQEVAR